MSEDTLTDPAPVDDSAATAPVSDDAVGEASGQGLEATDLIPKERFNGLMSKFNKTQEQLSAAEAAIAEERQRAEALEARLQAIEDKKLNEPETEEPPVSDTQTAEQVALLTQMLLEERLENAKAKVLNDFPEVAPLADLITASDPDEYRRVAEDIASRLKDSGAKTPEGEGAPPAETQETPPAATTDVPVGGAGTGSIGTTNTTSVEEKVAEAVKSRDFAAYLRTTRERANAEATTDLVLS